MSYSKTTTSNRSLVKEPVKQHLVHTDRFKINAASEDKKGTFKNFLHDTFIEKYCKEPKTEKLEDSLTLSNR